MGGVFETKLNKLIFYVDFLSFQLNSTSITGAEYKKIQRGPVPAHYGNLRDKLEDAGFVELVEHDFGNGVEGTEFKLGPNVASLSAELSAAEMRLVDQVIEEFRDYNRREIINRSHREKAWLATEDKKLISYEHADSLSIMGE